MPDRQAQAPLVSKAGERQPRLPFLAVGPQTMMGQSEVNQARARMAAGLRLAGFVCLILFAFVLVDPAPILAHLTAVSWSTVGLMIALHLVIILLASWRFAIIARASGARISLTDANRLTFGSTLANLVLPTSLAGDAGRAWLVRKFGLTLKSAMGVGLFDRIIGLGSLGAIVLMGTLVEPSIVPLWAVAAICLLSTGIAAMFLARWKPSERPPPSRGHFKQQRRGVLAVTVALSLAAHLVSIAIAFSFLNDQGVLVSIAQLLVLFPAVLLAASVPISIGGWGTREFAAAGSFAMIGLAAPTAIAMAFMFGVTQVVAAGCGTIYFARWGAGISAKND